MVTAVIVGMIGLLLGTAASVAAPSLPGGIYLYMMARIPPLLGRKIVGTIPGSVFPFRQCSGTGRKKGNPGGGAYPPNCFRFAIPAEATRGTEV